MARGRRKNNLLDDAVNSHERWLISYADFVTLLFALFVVMYSISSVNSAKYSALSESLEEAFSAEHKVLQTDGEAVIAAPLEDEQPVDKVSLKGFVSDSILEERYLLRTALEQLENVLQPYIEKGLVEVKQNEFWIELEMNDELVFLSGRAEFSRKAGPILKEISDVVSQLPNEINIEGHTDNMPIGTVLFPSNWELSSARATAVVRAFIRYGVSPSRLSAIGYGKFHPIASNASEEGRNKNRRVVLVLMSQALSRHGTGSKERAALLHLNE